VSDKQYLFSCITEIIGRIEMYIDNFRSLPDKYANIDLSDYNRRFINVEVEVIKDIVNIVTPQKKAPAEKSVVIPLYETPVSAGVGSWLSDETPVEWITVTKNDKTATADFMLEVRGDSMQPKFFDGDRVLVMQSESIYEGEIGVFILNNESYIKKMGRGELISLNPAYQPIKLTEFDNIRCAGKVLGTI
jgi:SOS-response transcriptional repressor LexA